VIDPSELAEYEAWKLRKIEGQLDLTITAFNAEMESQALAWEEGAKSLLLHEVNSSDQEKIMSLMRWIEGNNPFRAKGMRGYREPSPELPADRAPSAAEAARAEFQ
jgi:hypothetical protein